MKSVEFEFSSWWDDQIGALKEHRFTTIHESMESLVERYADVPGTVYLASGGTEELEGGRSRFDLLAVHPLLEIRSFGKEIRSSFLGEGISFVGSPFSLLREILNKTSGHESGDLPTLSGLFGYLSYDLLHEIETVPRTTRDLVGLPDLHLVIPQQLYLWDRRNGECIQIEPVFSRFQTSAQPLTNTTPKDHLYQSGRTLRPFFEFKYEQGVREIKRRISLGDVYQVNLSQSVQHEFSGSAFGLFKDLLKSNPAPFSSYVQAGDHQIISNSPERFLMCRGGKVQAQPIKGTRPRGCKDHNESLLKEELLKDPKDDAELSMIVDLFRNDLSRVAKVGSVVVVKHKLIEEYSSLYHLSSLLYADLAPEVDLVDLLRATFPSGSITGCPKIRAMEIIDELESTRRGIYTGAIGYIGFQSTLDLSVAIRTAVVANGTLTYSVGAGIVYDSDPAKECREVLAKGEPFERLLTRSARSRQSQSWGKSGAYVWRNGEFLTEESLPFSMEEEFPIFGFGVFETIRIHHESPLFLRDHLERMKRSLEKLSQIVHFDFEEFHQISWASIISQLLKKNGLLKCVAKVRISFGVSQVGSPPHWIVTAKPYRDPIGKREGRWGFRTKIFPEVHLSWLNEIKSHSYLHYRMARLWAQAHGFEEALLVDDHSNLIEGAFSSLLEIDLAERSIYIPDSKFQLRSLSRERALRWFGQKGYSLKTRDIDVLSLKENPRRRELWLLNSLMGAVPVVSVDDIPIYRSENNRLIEDLNSNLLCHLHQLR